MRALSSADRSPLLTGNGDLADVIAPIEDLAVSPPAKRRRPSRRNLVASPDISERAKADDLQVRAVIARSESFNRKLLDASGTVTELVEMALKALSEENLREISNPSSLLRGVALLMKRPTAELGFHDRARLHYEVNGFISDIGVTTLLPLTRNLIGEILRTLYLDGVAKVQGASRRLADMPDSETFAQLRKAAAAMLQTKAVLEKARFLGDVSIETLKKHANDFLNIVMMHSTIADLPPEADQLLIAAYRLKCGKSIPRLREELVKEIAKRYAYCSQVSTPLNERAHGLRTLATAFAAMPKDADILLCKEIGERFLAVTSQLSELSGESHPRSFVAHFIMEDFFRRFTLSVHQKKLITSVIVNDRSDSVGAFNLGQIIRGLRAEWLHFDDAAQEKFKAELAEWSLEKPAEFKVFCRDSSLARVLNSSKKSGLLNFTFADIVPPATASSLARTPCRAVEALHSQSSEGAGLAILSDVALQMNDLHEMPVAPLRAERVANFTQRIAAAARIIGASANACMDAAHDVKIDELRTTLLAHAENPETKASVYVPFAECIFSQSTAPLFHACFPAPAARERLWAHFLNNLDMQGGALSARHLHVLHEQFAREASAGHCYGRESFERLGEVTLAFLKALPAEDPLDDITASVAARLIMNAQSAGYSPSQLTGNFMAQLSSPRAAYAAATHLLSEHSAGHERMDARSVKQLLVLLQKVDTASCDDDAVPGKEVLDRVNDAILNADLPASPRTYLATVSSMQLENPRTISDAHERSVLALFGLLG